MPIVLDTTRQSRTYSTVYFYELMRAYIPIIYTTGIECDSSPADKGLEQPVSCLASSCSAVSFAGSRALRWCSRRFSHIPRCDRWCVRLLLDVVAVVVVVVVVVVVLSDVFSCSSGL